jgi:hypothetical protein
MKKQREMVESFQMEHFDFIKNFEVSLDILDHDIQEAKEIDSICTGTWCNAIENSIDELSNYLYSISEPRWLADTDSQQLHRMRTRIHDLYTRYRSLVSRVTH